jgi:arginase family enzyme
MLDRSMGLLDDVVEIPAAAHHDGASLGHPIMRTLRHLHPELSIAHANAHPDTYREYQGNPPTRASPFTRTSDIVALSSAAAA